MRHSARPSCFRICRGWSMGATNPARSSSPVRRTSCCRKAFRSHLRGALESCACCRFLMVKSFAAHSARRALGVGRIVGAIRASSHRISIRSISTPRMSRRIWNVMSARSSAWRRFEEFSRFIQLCALRSGELLNVSSLASDCGISPATANNWISILSSSYVIHLLRPYATNREKGS